MIHLFRHFFALFLGVVATSLAAAPVTLALAHNLKADAATMTAKGDVVVILYSRSGCPYCEKVRQHYLIPLSQNPRYRHVRIRQVDSDRSSALIDWQGHTTTHRAFAAGNDISLVPVVAFYNRHGEAVASPIVGALLDDFYWAYLEKALSTSEPSQQP